VLNSDKNLHNHPSAEDVYSDIIKNYPNISKATVYRNLNEIHKAGIVDKIIVPGGADIYDATTDGHHHAICKLCGDFIDLDLKFKLDINLDQDILMKNKIDSYLILFNGICDNCR